MPGFALLEASFVVAAIGAVVAGLGAGMLEFGVRFGVKDGTLLGMLLAMLVVRLSAITNPVSGALAVFTAAVVAVCGAAAGPGCTETPGLASLGASFFVGAIGVGAIGTGPGAGALEFGVRFGVKGGALLLGMLLEMSLEMLSAMLSVRLGTMANPASAALAVCAAAVLVALDGRTWAGAVSRVGEPDVGAGSAAVELSGLELPGAELLSPTGDCRVGIGVGAQGPGWSEELPGSDDGIAFARSVAGGAGVDGAAGTAGDWTV